MTPIATMCFNKMISVYHANRKHNAVKARAISATCAYKLCALISLIVSVAASQLLLSNVASARQDDFSKPIDVRADRSQYDEQAGLQTLSGNVEITQGTIRIEADEIRITLQDNRLSRIDGTGSPIRFYQENDAGEPVTGEAASIRYDAVAGNLILEGNATLSQPRQELASERIEFDSLTQTVKADGVSADGSKRGRVSIRIQPPTATDRR